MKTVAALPHSSGQTRPRFTPLRCIDKGEPSSPNVKTDGETTDCPPS